MKNGNIQLLRGVSILLVIFTHLGIFIPNSATFKIITSYFDTSIGVDLFFVISGYLMGETFIKKIKNKELTSADAFNFYQRRIVRLYIPCLFWSFFILSFSWVWLELKFFKELKQIVGVFFGAITFTGNFFNATHPTVFGYFWSLGVEMQFYLFLPILVVFSKNRRWIPCLLLLLIFTAAYGNSNIWWMFRANALFVGLLLWFATQTPSFDTLKDSLNRLPPAIVTTIFFLAITCACFLSYPYIVFGGIRYTITALILALVFYVVAFYEKPVLGFIHKPLSILGNISFSLYLCHLPIFLIVKYIFSKHISNPHTLAMIGVVFAIAMAFPSYFILEKTKK